MQTFVNIVYRQKVDSQEKYSYVELVYSQYHNFLPSEITSICISTIWTGSIERDLSMTLRSSKVKLKLLYKLAETFLRMDMEWICIAKLSRCGPIFGHYQQKLLASFINCKIRKIYFIENPIPEHYQLHISTTKVQRDYATGPSSTPLANNQWQLAKIVFENPANHQIYENPFPSDIISWIHDLSTGSTFKILASNHYTFKVIGSYLLFVAICVQR